MNIVWLFAIGAMTGIFFGALLVSCAISGTIAYCMAWSWWNGYGLWPDE